MSTEQESRVVFSRRAPLRAGTTRIKLKVPRRVQLGPHMLVVSAVAAGAKANASGSRAVRIVR